MSGPVVAVVDDDESLCRALARILEAAGMQAVTFASAEALLESGRIDADAFVLDVQLPGIDGFELYARLRAAGACGPAVFMSARDEAQARAEALGCTFLAKAFSGRLLVEMVQRAIARAA